MPTLPPTIKDYMTAAPLRVRPDQSLLEAEALMEEAGIRHLPVVDKGRPVGLLSQRDIQLVRGLDGLDIEVLSVDDVIDEAPYSVSAHTPIAEVARHMADHRYGSAIVVEQGKVIGIFTTVDALRVLEKFCGK